MINLNLTAISDIYERENFLKIQTYLNALSDIVNMDLISTEITTQDTQLAHNLGFVPTDLIQTRFENPNATINWLYEKFDKNFLYFTVVLPSGTTDDDTKYGLNLLVGRLGS